MLMRLNNNKGFTRTSSLKKSLSGFTIIEVLIVLAIAGLILVVVLLAVPALQRGQRNSARKTDATRVAAAIVDFTSNSQGSLPTTVQNCTDIYASAATLAQYTGFTCTVSALPASEAAITDLRFYVATSPANYTAPAAGGAAFKGVLMLAEGTVCSGANSVTTTGATPSRSTALLYTLESGNSYSWACVNPQ